MRVSNRQLNSSLKRQIQKVLAQVVADTKNEKKALEFLNHFFTESEFETFAKRLATAYWLKKGRSYTNIRENIKVSSATIATIQNMMTKPGFSEAIKKIEAEEWANQWSEKIKKFINK
jgi:uncharacterized protein YerC